MAVMIVDTRVKDWATWRPYYDSERKRRKKYGVKDWTIAHEENDPNHVYLILKVKDPEKAQNMLNDPEIQEIMKKSGVLNPPVTTILKDWD